ncbi:small-conductance mechanosensitive channel [Rhizobium azooxidifex]|uniref:Small-conductance mechanosensitive channel n=1 Tax=Mycoplana azooxidifex TaxID=1636188 RepID=A0A7W6DE11_9HYPH|nr:mechanosensitive ion channel domain-containing protein [Mycoplana azooxidifex]MBB3979511.1 small-conductance mechanosensitive channel [Mycoplana azooxidifex]
MRDLFLSPLVQVVLLGIAGIIAWHLQGRNRATARLVTQIAFFSAMTAILVVNDIAPTQYEPIRSVEGYLLVTAKLLWWVHLAWATIGFVRIYVVLDGRPREARMLQDLIVAAVYLGVALSALAYVFGIAIGTLVATSGIIAIILGLALQSTLNDLFSGLALTLGRPYGIGDWILLSDGTEGRVMENTWRSTHILTSTNNIVVLPNSYLAKIGLTNVSRPDEAHQVMLPLRIRPTHSPRFVLEAVRKAMIASNRAHHGHPPVVALKRMDALALDIELLFHVASHSERTAARNEIADLVYRQCKAIGIALALPDTATVLLDGAAAGPPAPQTVEDLLQSSPVFEHLEKTGIEKIARGANLRCFEADDLLPPDGSPTLMIIRSGAAVGLQGETEELRLGSGDLVGNLGDADEALTFKALTGLEVFEIDGQALETAFRDLPALRTELSHHLTGVPHPMKMESRPEHGAKSPSAFLRTIQHRFRRR